MRGAVFGLLVCCQGFCGEPAGSTLLGETNHPTHPPICAIVSVVAPPERKHMYTARKRKRIIAHPKRNMSTAPKALHL